MTAAIDLRNVHKVYNQIPVVNDLSFAIETGKFSDYLVRMVRENQRQFA